MVSCSLRSKIISNVDISKNSNPAKAHSMLIWQPSRHKKKTTTNLISSHDGKITIIGPYSSHPYSHCINWAHCPQGSFVWFWQIDWWLLGIFATAKATRRWLRRKVMWYLSLFIGVALRQARRDRQLVSKRLLLNEDEDQPEVTMDTNSGEQVRQMVW